MSSTVLEVPVPRGPHADPDAVAAEVRFDAPVPVLGKCGLRPSSVRLRGPFQAPRPEDRLKMTGYVAVDAATRMKSRPVMDAARRIRLACLSRAGSAESAAGSPTESAQGGGNASIMPDSHPTGCE